jgi:arylsulfatase A-like enzyme/Tfp pilus assembly protein PilF
VIFLRGLVISALVLTAGCTRAYAPTHNATPRNVVLITIDTLRADRVGRGLTPSIDALAARGVRFTNARAVVPLTLPSHTVIMTGELPSQTGVQVNGAASLTAGHPTIARALKDAGYRTGAFVGAYVLDRRFGLADGFDVYDDRVQRDQRGSITLEAQRRGDAVVDAALHWLTASNQTPFFAWIHLYDPHAPYEPPPEYLARANNVPYDGEVAFADAQVGRVLEWLKTSGQEGRTVIVVAGDHGEGLGDHGEATHGMLLYDSTLRVPLVMAGPNIDSRLPSLPVSLASLAPTVIGVAGVSIPRSMRLPSLLSADKPADPVAETEYPRSAGWHALTALADDRWKLIVSSERELYDLASDPGETRNLAEWKASIADAMAGALTARVKPGPSSSASIPTDAAERLRALGYVSGAPTTANDDNAPNPAKHIAAWNTFERELGRLTAGDARGALPGLAALARSAPDSPLFQSTYARALKEAGRVHDALVIYRKLVARWPGDASLYHDLAVAAESAGQPKEAARAEQAALALEPSNPAAANGLGLIQIEAGRTADAIKAFEQAVKGDPSNAVFWTNLGNARRDAGDAAGAEQAYRTALDRDPRSADAANGIGVLLVQAHRATEAIPWFERALAASPQFIEARLNLGIAYQESGAKDRAAEAYQRVLKSAAPASREYRAASTLLQHK